MGCPVDSFWACLDDVFLGKEKEVGNFTTVRQLNPEVVRPQTRSILPAGSATLQELYQLGQDEDGRSLWQVEFQNRTQPTVAEQFTNGVMQNELGDYMGGINQIWSLKQRQIPEERSQWLELRQQPSYWQALYPFPFLEIIENGAKQSQLNPLLVTALIRQESRFMPKIRSGAGAVGLMQVMPTTGQWVAGKINFKNYNLENPADNVKLGTWFLDYTHREYNNNSLLAVASYNAGPGNVAKWMREKGFNDPDEFVEAIPFEETREYVKSVFGNYWNYLRLYSPTVSQLLKK